MDLRKRWKDILYILMGLFLIAVLMLRADVTDTLDIMSYMDMRIILVVLFLYFLNTFCKVARWHGILKGMGARRTGLSILPIYLASLALNNSTPGKVGGEPVRALMLKEHTGNRGSLGIASIFAEKSLDILTILTLAVFGMVYLIMTLGFNDVRGMVFSIGIGGILILSVILMITSRRFLSLVNRILDRIILAFTKGEKDHGAYRFARRSERAVDRFHVSLLRIRGNRWTGTGVIIMTIVIWINEALRLYLIIHAMPGDMNITFPGAIAAISVANILGFVLPVGSGNIIGSTSVLVLLTGDETSATAASITQVVTSLWISIPLGLLSILCLKKRSSGEKGKGHSHGRADR